MTGWVGPEGGVDDFDILLGNEFGIVVVFFIKAFLKGVVHGVNGCLAIFIASHGVDVRLLNEKEQEKESCKGCDDDDF